MNRARAYFGAGIPRKALCVICGLVVVVALGGVAAGAEIHSNGSGGGEWTDPATWHGGAVPAAADDVVIAMRDVVVCNIIDPQQPACRNLYIDPEGVLSFADGGGHYVLAVDGSIESYGLIRMDGTKTARGIRELRMLAFDGPPRIELKQNAGVLAYGREGLPRGERNVRIVTLGPGEEGPRHVTTLTADGDVMIDLHHTQVTDLVVEVRNLDNTGAQTTERLNIMGNRFTGLARLVLVGCDTPVVRDNHFEAGDTSVPNGAIHVHTCKLAELRGNRIEGKYERGLFVQSDVDSSAVDNFITGSGQGIYWHGVNAMTRGNTIENCPIGFLASTMTGVIEQTTVTNAAEAIQLTDTEAQMTDCRVEGIPEGGFAMTLNNSTATLLNCNIMDDQLNLQASRGGAPFVTAMAYLVVRATGDVPQGAMFEVRTAEVSGGVPAGKADLNVRNSPAPLDRTGLTPLPRSTRAMVVRSWSVAADKKVVSPPFYDLRIIAPPPAPNEAPRIVKTVENIEPGMTWYRADPDARSATMEVTLP